MNTTLENIIRDILKELIVSVSDTPFKSDEDKAIQTTIQKLSSLVDIDRNDYQKELLFQAFKAGENWGVTYSTWFTPEENQDRGEFIKWWNNPKEFDSVKHYILCPAIWYKDFPLGKYQPFNIDKGIVLCGHRHPSIISQHNILLNKRSAEMGEYEQGFLTSKNEFVSREDAPSIAYRAKQIDQRKRELFSEDLY